MFPCGKNNEKKKKVQVDITLSEGSWQLLPVEYDRFHLNWEANGTRTKLNWKQINGEAATTAIVLQRENNAKAKTKQMNVKWSKSLCSCWLRFFFFFTISLSAKEVNVYLTFCFTIVYLFKSKKYSTKTESRTIFCTERLFTIQLCVRAFISSASFIEPKHRVRSLHQDIVLDGSHSLCSFSFISSRFAAVLCNLEAAN